MSDYISRHDRISVFAKIEHELRSLSKSADAIEASLCNYSLKSLVLNRPTSKINIDLQNAIAQHQRGQLAEAEQIRLRGLSGARDEFHVAAIVQNLKSSCGLRLPHRGRLRHPRRCKLDMRGYFKVNSEAEAYVMETTTGGTRLERL